MTIKEWETNWHESHILTSRVRFDSIFQIINEKNMIFFVRYKMTLDHHFESFPHIFIDKPKPLKSQSQNASNRQQPR